MRCENVWYAGATRPVAITVSRRDGKPMVITMASVQIREQASGEWGVAAPISPDGTTLTANVTPATPGVWEIRFNYTTEDGINDTVVVKRRIASLD